MDQSNDLLYEDLTMDFESASGTIRALDRSTSTSSAASSS
jgi:hypothetical protein